MAQTAEIDLIATALWPQGDARDPLGVWGARDILTGNGTGGGTSVVIRAPADIAGAYVYTCYSANVSSLSLQSTAQVQCRLLTNWPDIDREGGVQGYATNIVSDQISGSVFVEPRSGPNVGLVQPNDRFILLFDPRPVVGAFNIVALQINDNTSPRTYTFEAYGYYWDRQVLQTPGGPRHPGSA